MKNRLSLKCLPSILMINNIVENRSIPFIQLPHKINITIGLISRLHGNIEKQNIYEKNK